MKKFACLLGFLVTVGGVSAASASDYLGCQLKYGEYPGVKGLPEPLSFRVAPNSYGAEAPQVVDVSTSLGLLHFEDEDSGNGLLLNGREIEIPKEARLGAIKYGKVYDLGGAIFIAINKDSQHGREKEIQLLVDKDGRVQKSNISTLMPPPAGHCSLTDD